MEMQRKQKIKSERIEKFILRNGLMITTLACNHFMFTRIDINLMIYTVVSKRTANK